MYTPYKNPRCWGIFIEIESSLLFEFIKYYWEKCKWFFNICWRFNCLIKISRSIGVFYSVCISSPLIKGWSKTLIFKLRSSLIVIEFPLKLEKNVVAFYFKVGTLNLCCCHSYYVKSLKLFICILSPRSFINTSRTLLHGAFNRF